MMQLVMPRLGLRHKFALAVTLSMLIPTSLAILLAYQLIQGQTDRAVTQRIDDNLYLINQQIDSIIGTAIADTDWLSRVFPTELINTSARGSDDLEDWLQTFLLRHEDYCFISVRLSQGTAFTVRRPAEPTRAIPPVTLNLTAGYTPTLLQPTRSSDGGLETAIITRLKDGSGIIEIGVSLESIRQLTQLAAEELESPFILADPAGNVIIHPKLKTGQPLNDAAYRGMLGFANQGMYPITANDGTSSRIVFNTNKETDWKLAFISPDKNLHYATSAMVRSFGSIIGLALLIGLFISALLASLTLRPIRAYREAFLRMKDGDLAVTMAAHSSDEWSRLAGTFNQMTQSIRSYALSDPLTGLPDRRRMMQLLERHLHIAQERGGQPFAIWFLDVDNFKQMNDTQGHAFGDDVVRQVALELQRLMPAPNTVARFGGDEFVILMPNANELTLRASATKLQERFERGIQIHGKPFRVQLSVGVSLYPKDGETTEALIGSADHAMYRAKRKGKNNVQFH
ncbi:diguanylate cyclase domain-containing protein [Paenibacillus sp. MMS18-CY102]|uniref:diguanylate cyclase domain-containing protein n=1 Tax=Paenibacillus sp. MMS18-CY102 TaxID=2682849 RepID=UPI001366001E|nr:diguanylate cyclase [Paenibacillus sp. MMS18-CY102]MWC31121.1 diguanylate cyclase [Paenibacillus sp. MMS18-CY102]